MFQIDEYQGADGQRLKYGRLTHSEQTADRPAMLYIPGLGGSVKGVLGFLEGLMPDFNPIYGADLRSFGLNPPPAPEEPLHSTDLLLEDLEAFYQQVILPARHSELVLCGISLGAVIATLLAVRHPERFCRLVLLAPAYQPNPKSFGLRYRLRNSIKFLLQGRRARTRLPYGIADLTRNESVLNDPQYAQGPPLILNPGFLLSAQELCRQAYRETGRLTVPTMMVIPGQDLVCDAAAMRRAFENIPASTPKRCREYPEFYHDVLLEDDAPLIAQELLGWSSRDSCARASSSR